MGRLALGGVGRRLRTLADAGAQPLGARALGSRVARPLDETVVRRALAHAERTTFANPQASACVAEIESQGVEGG